MLYTPTASEESQVENNFAYHKPHDPSQARRYEDIRARTMNAAHFLLMACPPSRERSLALTKLEEAMMWAIAAIARNEKPTVDAGG